MNARSSRVSVQVNRLIYFPNEQRKSAGKREHSSQRAAAAAGEDSAGGFLRSTVRAQGARRLENLWGGVNISVGKYISRLTCTYRHLEQVHDNGHSTAQVPFLPPRGTPGRVPLASRVPQSSHTSTGTANNTMVIQPARRVRPPRGIAVSGLEVPPGRAEIARACWRRSTIPCAAFGCRRRAEAASSMRRSRRRTDPRC